MNVIEVQNLKKYFGRTHAVDRVNFSVSKGEVFGFLGPNGAGKTTTIRCMMDFLKPTEGTITILGQNIQDSENIKNSIGYLSGDVRLYDGWTGNDHIKFLEKLRKKKSIADSLLEKLNLNPRIKFKALSSGNKQKLGLVLALMFEPELIIMDEPTLGLDPLLQNAIYTILEDFKNQGRTIFFSSHNLAEVDRICSRVAIIKDGKIVAVEGIRELKEKRMHLVTVHFSGPFNKYDFSARGGSALGRNLDGIQIQQEIPEGLVLGVKGDINPLIKLLASYNLKELEISHASLEEIFLEFYAAKQQSEPLIMPQPPNNDLNNIPKIE